MVLAIVVLISGAFIAWMVFMSRNPALAPKAKQTSTASKVQVEEVLSAAQKGSRAAETSNSFLQEDALRSSRGRETVRFAPVTTEDLGGTSMKELVEAGAHPAVPSLGSSRDPLSRALEASDTPPATPTEEKVEEVFRLPATPQAGSQGGSPNAKILKFEGDPRAEEENPPNPSEPTLPAPGARRPANYLPLGGTIPVTVQTPINTANPDPMVRLQVNGSVRFRGRNRIPVGTTILATPQYSGRYGDTRVYLTAHTILYPDGSTTPIDALIRSEDYSVGLEGYYHDQPLEKRAIDVATPIGLVALADQLSNRTESTGGSTTTSQPSQELLAFAREMTGRELEKLDERYPPFVEIKRGTRGVLELQSAVDLRRVMPPESGTQAKVGARRGNGKHTNQSSGTQYRSIGQILNDFPELPELLASGEPLPPELLEVGGPIVEQLISYAARKE